MWSKLSSALKHRPSTPSFADGDDEPLPSKADVLAEVYEQHPNLSVFHADDPAEGPITPSSPTMSPGMTGRKSIFKKPSRPQLPLISTQTNEQAMSTPIMSPLMLPKKVKSSLQNLASVSELSLGRSSSESSHRPPHDSLERSSTPISEVFKFGSLRSRTPQDAQPTYAPRPVEDSTSHNRSNSGSPADDVHYGSLRSYPQEGTHAARMSQDSAVSLPDNKPPTTPTADARYSSIRSILRDRNTPATGQSVRFFSRDAYKVITPDVSSASSEPDEVSFAARLVKARSARPVAQEVFANSMPNTPSMLGQAMPSMLTEVAPPNVSNIFDMSAEGEMPMIPAGREVPLLDNAVELSEAEAPNEDHEHSMPLTPPAKLGMHDRSHSFSFGQTVFRSLTSPVEDAWTSTPPPGPSFTKSRSRALSDTVFHSFASVPTKGAPEADINDPAALKVYSSRPPSPERPKEKDPFGAHATTFFTPGTVPPTPPDHPVHTRKVSREEDNAWRLQTALSLKEELCVQYEADLAARDELVALLQQSLAECEKECERRKGLVKGWRRRVAELEKCVRGLSEEVERSREEASERSVMDEASGAALREMHRRIGDLERECKERERREDSVREEMSTREDELERIKEALRRKEDSEQELQRGIRDAREEMERMQLDLEMSGNHGPPAPAPTIRETSRSAEGDWAEERARLLAENEALRSEQMSLQAQLTDAREQTLRRDSELHTLRDELEAQWRNTEDAGERMNVLTRERDALKAEVDVLNERISTMEVEWAQGENGKAELEHEVQELLASKDELERECGELEAQVHAADEHSEELTRALQEREVQVTSLRQEKQYMIDRVARFEAQLEVRDTEAEEMRKRVLEAEAAKDAAEEDAARMKREHARIVNDQSRTLQEVVAREVEARANFEAHLKAKGETDVELGTLRDRANTLQEEVNKLRKQVHTLQQESADKEVRLVNLQKQRAQDKEDMQGLNIALDSKQQELELLKRRMSVRGTTSATPAASSKVPPYRRESSIFGTPSVVGSRPPSVLSDTGSTKTPTTVKGKATDNSSTAKAALARSVRANGPTMATSTTAIRKRSLEGTMGPPPAIMRTNSASASKDATPTRIPSGSSLRASIAGPPSAFIKNTPTPTHVRRTSVSSRLPTPLVGREREVSISADEKEKEKENTAPKARRMSMLAT